MRCRRFIFLLIAAPSFAMGRTPYAHAGSPPIPYTRPSTKHPDQFTSGTLKSSDAQGSKTLTIRGATRPAQNPNATGVDATIDLVFVQKSGKGAKESWKSSTDALKPDQYFKLSSFLTQAVKREAQWKKTPFTKPETFGAVIGSPPGNGIRLSLRREGPNQTCLTVDQTGGTFVTRTPNATRQFNDAVGAVVVWLNK